MIYKIKQFIKKITPPWLLAGYHFVLAWLGHAVYGFPSRKLYVIGVTGTKGKTTTCNMIWQIMTQAGYTTGMTTTANIRIGEQEWINDTKMTMQGRFAIARLLRQMVRAGCTHAVIETSSEGIKQFRHKGIQYQVGVLTNLSPEHIESHGSFENYRAAKAQLLTSLHGDKISVLNHDDMSYDFFVARAPQKKQIHDFGIEQPAQIRAGDIEPVASGSYFVVDTVAFFVPLPGMFNVYNALAAIATTTALGVVVENQVAALKTLPQVPGRMERIEANDYTVYVDYAHTPESLEAVYQTLAPHTDHLIAVIGSAGGGRDKSRRPKMGALASQYAQVVIVTNEDPYDEDPEEIIDQVWAGIDPTEVTAYKVCDRRAGIEKALSLAKKDSIVVITGKGSEQCIVVGDGKKIPWDDREVVQSLLLKMT